jgi:hypothetical protein
MRGQFSIDGRDARRQWGVAMLRGSTHDFLTFLSPKPKLTHDWEDEDGEDVLYTPYYAQARDISVECVMTAVDSTDFWQKYQDFYEYMRQARVYFYIVDFNKAYRLRLVEYGKAQRWGSMEHGGRILMKFSMKLQESNPTLTIYNGIVDGAALTLPITDSNEFMAI